MNKEYICYEKKITKAIKQIKSFKKLINKANNTFNENYNYKIKLNKIKNKWQVIFKVTNNEIKKCKKLFKETN